MKKTFSTMKKNQKIHTLILLLLLLGSRFWKYCSIISKTQKIGNVSIFAVNSWESFKRNILKNPWKNPATNSRKSWNCGSITHKNSWRSLGKYSGSDPWKNRGNLWKNSCMNLQRANLEKQILLEISKVLWKEFQEKSRWNLQKNFRDSPWKNSLWNT